MASIRERIQPSVLVLEDDAALAQALQEYLQEEGWDVEVASTGQEARTKLGSRTYDLVLADYLLPDENGLCVLDELTGEHPITKVMVMTGVKDMEVAAQAFKKGASDLITKPFKMNQLLQRIDQVMEHTGSHRCGSDVCSKIYELRGRIERLMEDKRVGLSQQSSGSPVAPVNIPDGMVGQTPAMEKVFRLIQLVKDTDATVLISGESGTGKELVARAIHAASPRAANEFVAINCGAIPEHLLESELFGHVRGAYTDARNARVGKLEHASGGTLFLDEIGEMPMILQVKLLRVLERRMEFQRLGSNQSVRVDVRVISATNSDLAEKVGNGHFRADLFYRLNVVPVHLPPLRERTPDVSLLADFILRTISQDYDIPPKRLSAEAVTCLTSYGYPGNVRELRNVLELAYVLSGEREELMIEDFPALAHPPASKQPDAGLIANVALPHEGINLNQVVSQVERHLICESLKRTGGNKGKAARLLYLKRTTLVEKLRRMNLLEEFSR